MASPWVKYSENKIVLHSDLQVRNAQGKITRKDYTLNIGTWNVRSLRKLVKLENLKKEMDRLKLDIVEISEVKWIHDQDFWSRKYSIIKIKLVRE